MKVLVIGGTRFFVKQAAGILGTTLELVNIPSDLLNRTPLGTSFSPYFSRRPFVLDIQKLPSVAGNSLAVHPLDIFQNIFPLPLVQDKLQEIIYNVFIAQKSRRKGARNA